MIEVLVLVLSLVLPGCPYEDSRNCYWNAETRGNLEGDSFVNVAGYNLRSE